VEEEERRKVAAEMIAFDLERLRRAADANGLTLLAYLLDMAIVEASSEANKET
jgi:hypothetical protein